MVILVADLIASYNRTIEQDKAQTRQRGYFYSDWIKQE
jgi:sugar diacid utilization regulator